MGDRRYKPGKARPLTREGKMSENRVAWTRNVQGEFVVMRYEKDDPPEGESVSIEPGPTIRLFIPRKGGQPLAVTLTALTEDELSSLEELFNLAFELARPVVLERDRVAREAFSRGDDSFARVYRQIPQLFVRERAFGADGKGIYDRSSGVPLRRWRDEHPDPRVRGEVDALAPVDAEDRRTEDDEPPGDQPESVCEVRRDAGGYPHGLPWSDGGEGDPAPSA